MKKVRFGILSTAQHGIDWMIPALQKSQLCEVTAIASRDLSKAQQTAKQFNIPKAYGSYKELLTDPDIDAIYNPLPNHLHLEWTIKALEAGKHTLCEKPLTMNTQEAEKLLEEAKKYTQLKVMEAFMYRFHPQWIKTKELIESGTIGQLKTVQAFFSYYNDDPKNIRNKADIGGGALLDIGCYDISIPRFLFDAEPVRVVRLLERDPSMGTDRLISGMLEFEKGTATFTCSTQVAPYQRVNAVGTLGRIEIEIPVNSPADIPTRIWLQTEGNTEEITFDPCNQYSLEADAFTRAILENLPVPTPLEDAVANMRVIDAFVKSAEKGGWEKL